MALGKTALQIHPAHPSSSVSAGAEVELERVAPAAARRAEVSELVLVRLALQEGSHLERNYGLKSISFYHSQSISKISSMAELSDGHNAIHMIYVDMH